MARVLDATTVTPDSLVGALMGVLEDPAYRRAAEGLAAEVQSLPAIEHVVARLEQLASAGRPVYPR